MRMIPHNIFGRELITGYFIAPIKGEDGGTSLEVAWWLMDKFPNVWWIIPHAYELFIKEAIALGISTDEVVRIWSSIASKCDIAVMYDGNGVSEGMASEEDARGDKPTVTMDVCGEEARVEIEQMIIQVM